MIMNSIAHYYQFISKFIIELNIGKFFFWGMLFFGFSFFFMPIVYYFASFLFPFSWKQPRCLIKVWWRNRKGDEEDY
jgi:hypothetical protein